MEAVTTGMDLRLHRRSRFLPSALHTACAALLLLMVLPVLAQDSRATTSPSSSPSVLDAAPSQAGISPASRFSRIARGFNTEFSFNSLHDSQVGYSTYLDFDAGFDFNSTFSFQFSFPLYLYRLAPNQQTNPPPPPTHLLVARIAEPGDLDFAFNGQWGSSKFLYSGTFTVTAPTGDTTYGLSTGDSTVDFTNRFESTLGRFTPEIEIGVGDSSQLATQNITKNYTTLGPLSHFMAGSSVQLLHGLSYSLDAYEELPIGDQKIYSSVRSGRVFTTVVSGINLTEDNGFINSIEIPLGRHTFLTGYYTRSLRQHKDYAGASISFTLHGAPQDDLESNVAALFR